MLPAVLPTNDIRAVMFPGSECVLTFEWLDRYLPFVQTVYMQPQQAYQHKAAFKAR